MRNLLPQQIRIYAALCHLAGLSWVLVISMSIGLVGMFSSLAIFLIISVLFPCITWLSTRRAHDFVDRAGREAVNAQLSVMLYTGCAMFATALACGMTVDMYATSALGLAAMLLIFTVMVYPIVSIVAAVQALRGNVLRYPLIIRFIPDPLLPL